jgi:hypothetical protein
LWQSLDKVRAVWRVVLAVFGNDPRFRVAGTEAGAVAARVAIPLLIQPYSIAASSGCSFFSNGAFDFLYGGIGHGIEQVGSARRSCPGICSVKRTPRCKGRAVPQGLKEPELADSYQLIAVS